MSDFWHEYIAATPQEQRPFYWLAWAVLVVCACFLIAGTLVGRHSPTPAVISQKP